MEIVFLLVVTIRNSNICRHLDERGPEHPCNQQFSPSVSQMRCFRNFLKAAIRIFFFLKQFEISIETEENFERLRDKFFVSKSLTNIYSDESASNFDTRQFYFFRLRRLNMK